MSERIDITGQRFGKLTVVSYTGLTNGRAMWLCQCDCGMQKNIQSVCLRNNKTKSCGCLKTERVKTHIGDRYNRLVVLSKHHNDSKRIYYECLCDCGNKRIIQGAHLRSDHTQSCGCYNRERVSKTMKIHGISKTKMYKNFHLHKKRELSAILDSEWTLEMEAALNDFQYFCAICDDRVNLHLDHVLALSSGNGLKPGNAVMLCAYHNCSKNDKTLEELPDDWREKILYHAQNFADYWEEVGMYYELSPF